MPLTMLKVPLVPLTLPTRLSCGWALTVVLLKLGALEAVPKLNVPARMSKAQGPVIAVDEGLSTSVQLAALLVIEMVLVPVGSALATRLVRVPRPASVSVVLIGATAVLVRPPPMINPPAPPSRVKLAPKSHPRSTGCGLDELLMMLPPGIIELPLSTKAPAPVLNTRS